jgi:hypothetical protein
MPTAEVNRITIYYEVHRTGEPLVIIWGLSVDLTALEDIVSQLARAQRWYIYYLRGVNFNNHCDKDIFV